MSKHVEIFLEEYDVHPLDSAMKQSLNSRSSLGYVGNTEKAKAGKASEFIKKYYLGYNHKSVGDPASITLYAEGVSMLAAKAIQQNHLYSGIEASTRYIDLKHLGYYLPEYLPDMAKEVAKESMEIYDLLLEPSYQMLKEKNEKPEGVTDTVWENTLRAGAFDRCRAWLVAGQKTLLSWHTNLRQAGDNLDRMETHPLSEVRSMAKNMREKCKAAYPECFTELDANTRDFNTQYSLESNYCNLRVPQIKDSLISYSKVTMHRWLSSPPSPKVCGMLKDRPYKTNVPKHFNYTGIIKANIVLDFGSWRDLQRHRPIMTQAPLLTANIGFNKWYIDELPESLSEEVVERTKNIVKKLRAMSGNASISDVDLQYVMPMGMNVSCDIQGGLSDMAYLVELRTQKTVHETLRQPMMTLAKFITESTGVKLYVDNEANVLDSRRGTQTIVEK